MPDENGRLTDEELDEIAFQLPHVKAWVTAIEAQLLQALESGAEFKNVSLEPKRANRKWTSFILDENKNMVPFDVLKFLRKFSKLDVVAPRVPLSPTQAEKTLGRTVYGKCAEFVVRESSGMKLAFSHPEENLE